MNNLLILVVMVIYFMQALIFLVTARYGLALTFGAYAISNIGLYLVSRGL